MCKSGDIDWSDGVSKNRLNFSLFEITVIFGGQNELL